jgi:FkbM family methyltransferase
VGPAGRVLAFEPEPGNFELLKANLILNGCGNVELAALALAAEPGRCRLHLSAENAGDHRLSPTPGRAVVPVEAARFDDLRAGRGRLDFAKIDAQGSEVPVLLGMEGTVRANLGRLLCLVELSPRLSLAAGYDLGSLLGLLQRHDVVVGRHRLEGNRPAVERLGEAGFAALWAGLLADAREDAGETVVLAFGPAAWDRLAARLTAP